MKIYHFDPNTGKCTETRVGPFTNETDCEKFLAAMNKNMYDAGAMRMVFVTFSKRYDQNIEDVVNEFARYEFTYPDSTDSSKYPVYSNSTYRRLLEEVAKLSNFKLILPK